MIFIGVNDTFYHPSDFEKKIMVFTRIYPSMKSIPKTVRYVSDMFAEWFVYTL